MSSPAVSQAPLPASSLELKKGIELQSRYVVVDFIGSGGFGTVWRATDKQEGRDVAIKRLIPRSSMMGPTQSEVTAFLEEGRKTQRLKGHKNIVEVYDTFQEGSDAFIVMEFVEGSSLDAIFKERAFKDGWIATDEALDYFRQILEGLVFAHSGGLLHRDVKPSNILLSKLGVIKVVDFGLAKPMPFGKSISTHVAPGFAGTGTQPYMSFEQANGKEVDQQSDIFSAGIVGYILFSGSHP
ncbi:MAG TPA: serine/threonine-protein kinase, partial [Terriglobales bacterium]|nr:serine/threonine-protein kinase [Terriglobales bacterium]